MTMQEIAAGLPDELTKHLAGLEAEQRQEIRRKLQKRRCKTTADRQGKAVFLAILDKADEESTKGSE